MPTETTTITPSKLRALALLPESPRTASPQRSLCHECGRFESCSDPFVRPSPQGWDREVLLLFGQRPPSEALDYVINLAEECGIGAGSLWFFDAVSCGGRKPTTKQLRCCRPFVVHFVKAFKPKYIIAFGDVALRYITDNGKLKNITENRGVKFMVPGCEEERTIVYATYEPDSIIDGAFSLAPRLKEDFLRVRPRGLRALLEPKQALPTAATMGVDTEFKTDGTVVTLSASDTVQADCRDVSDSSGTARILGRIDKARTVAGHQVAVDLDSLIRLVRANRRKLKNLNSWLQGKQILDTIMLARMVDETRQKGGYKLEVLLKSNHHTPSWKTDSRVEDLSDPTTWPADYRVERCRMDGWASAVLAEELLPHAQGPVELTHRIAQTLRRIYHTGAFVDVKYHQKLTAAYFRESSKAKRKLLIEAGKRGMREFSPTNDNDLRELLFKHCGLVATEFTKEEKLPSVNKTFLKNNTAFPVVKDLIEFNNQDKRHSTYGLGLAKKFLANGISGRALLRFRVNPLGAKTGRRASDKPNAQNWPKDVRKIIVSRFVGGCIADNDYSKLEVILFAWNAQEWKLLEFFLTGNGYIAVGKELFGKEVKEDTDDYRTVKSIVLGIQYGMGAYKLAYELWNKVGVRLSADWKSHVSLAEQLREKYLNKFPQIRRYIWNQKQTLLREQQVVSLTGRVRHLHCPYGEDTPGFGRLLNQAINFPIQSLASDVTGSAMVDVEERLLDKYNLTYEEYHYRLLEGKYPTMPLLINEVHDDLVYDMPPRGLKDNLALIRETMADVPTLRKLCPTFDVPLNTSNKAGSRWGMNDFLEAA